MTTDGGVSSLKSKAKEQSIYFLFNSRRSQKCAALFKLKIITTEGEEDKNQNEEFISADEKELKLVQTFFDKHPDMLTANVACAHLGSGKYLFMPYGSQKEIPFQLEMQKPCVFDFVSKLTDTLDKAPLARKLNPVVASVGNKIYVLSRPTSLSVMLPEPSFEAYDPKNNSWETLIAPIFNQNTPPDHSPNSTWGWHSEGYAVFQEFIIMSFWKTGHFGLKSEFHSYNTLSGEWKRVQFTTTPQLVFPSDNLNNRTLLYWVGEAVVIKNFIYAYSGFSQGLVSYNCAKTISEGCDILSFDDKVVVESLEFRQNWAEFRKLEITGAVGKIRDDLICMVQTVFLYSNRDVVKNDQPVCVTIFRILEGGRCSRLQSFELSMPGTDLFRLATISCCNQR